MRCKTCGEENPLKAKYCKSCGHAFTDEEREESYNQTIYGKIDKLLDFKGWLDLSNITGHPAVRACILGVLVLLVIFNIMHNGNSFIIKNSDDYKIAYQEEYDEYYLFTDKSEINVDLYVPKKSEEIILETWDMNDELFAEETIDADTGFTVVASEEEYYTLTVEYEDGKRESIKFYVGKES